MEHRWGERIKVDIPVKLTVRRFGVRAARLTDLSVSGAFVRLGSNVRALSRVQVVIEMPLRCKQLTPVLSAYVARKFQDGIGIEWCDLAPAVVVELLRAARWRHPAASSVDTSGLDLPVAAPIPLLRHGT